MKIKEREMEAGKQPHKSRIKRLARSLMGSSDSPERIARGVAIGVFWGVLPTFGFAILFSVPTAFLLKANRLSAILGTFISNPLTGFFIWSFGYKIGQQILGLPPVDFSGGLFKLQSLLNLFKAFMVGGFLGNFILAIGISLLSYLVVLKVVAYYRRKHSSRSGGS